MNEIVELVAKTYGIVGLLILAPVAATVYLWKYVINLQKTLTEKDAEYIKQVIEVTRKNIEDLNKLHQSRLDDILKANLQVLSVQEKRVTDAQEVVGRLVTMISEQTAMNTETNLALERVGDFIANISNGKPHSHSSSSGGKS